MRIPTISYGRWAKPGMRVLSFYGKLATITKTESVAFGGDSDYPVRVNLMQCDLLFDDGTKDWEWSLTLKRIKDTEQPEERKV